MQSRSREGRFAERALAVVDDAGEQERVVVWIERRTGGVWVVGRSVDPEHAPSDEPRASDVLFEGYELDEALAAANEALEDDVSVIERDGGEARVRPFTRKDVIPVLERWFFDR